MARLALWMGCIAACAGLWACSSGESGGDPSLTAGASGNPFDWDAAAGGGGTAGAGGGQAGKAGSAPTGGSGGIAGSAGSSGSGANAGTGGTGGQGACSHDLCTQGAALVAGCSPCVTQVCDADPYCCAGFWDDQCVSGADNLCSLSCPQPPCTPESCPKGCCDPTNHCYENACQIYGVACGKAITPGTGTGKCDQCEQGKCYTCDTQTCWPCEPDCNGKSCGDPDGCGSRCDGTCPSGQFCSKGAAGCTSTCNDLSCPFGCCDGNGSCVDGMSDSACGQSGAVCKTCTPGSGACLPVYIYNEKSPGGHCASCDSTTCPNGCCTADGHCITTWDDAACGKGGAPCVDCTLKGSLCGYGGLCAECTAHCDGKSCGQSDGCGGACKMDCAAGLTCVVGSQLMKDGCYPCGPSTCNGCCTATGACVGGGLRNECGGQGAACQDCGTQACTMDMQTYPFTHKCGPCGSMCQPPIPGQPAMCQADGCGGLCPGSSCDGSPGPGGATCQITKGGWAQCVPSGFCDPYMCGGCCGYSGWNSTCEPGNLPSKCGTAGQGCVDCVALGTTCDPATRTCVGCTPQCSGASTCGKADGCGGICTGASGSCPAGASCNSQGVCECTGAGQSLCYDASYNTLCLDTASDPNNCGTCNNKCPSGVTCTDGSCDCPVGKHFCQGQSYPPSEGTCTNLASDPAHCGSCTQACPGTACVHGVCGKCPASTTACPYSDPPACADLMTDNDNCGACGNACPSGNPCVNGYCDCGGGMVNCNGTCLDVQTDPKNCGQCNQACPTGVQCQAGKCVCPGGTTLCMGQCTNLQIDPKNCGQCGMTCMGGQTCLGGQCM